MGVEALASIGKAVSVAPAVGRISMPRIEGRFKVGSIQNLALGVFKPNFIENGRLNGAIKNPSPVRSSFLEGESVPRMARSFSPDRMFHPSKEVYHGPAEIRPITPAPRRSDWVDRLIQTHEAGAVRGARVQLKQEPVVELKVEEVIAEAENIIKQVQRPVSVIARSEATKQSDQEIAALPLVARNDVWKQVYPKVESKPQVLVQTLSKPEVQVAVKPQTESVFAFAQPNPLELKAEEKKMQAQIEPEKKQEEEETEDEEETKKRFLKDSETLKIRLENLIAVISGIGEDEEFTGEMLKRLMPSETVRLRSEVLKKYTHTSTYETIVDGSYEEMLEAFGLLGKFRSKQEAYSKARRVVEEKVPIKWGKDGTSVSRKDVDRVFKRQLVKPNFMEEVEKRNSKKTIQQAA